MGLLPLDADEGRPAPTGDQDRDKPLALDSRESTRCSLQRDVEPAMEVK
jgi:hypothetical protein